MSSVKEALYHSIERLSDEEAHQTLVFIQQLHEQRDVVRILKRLAHHPAFGCLLRRKAAFVWLNRCKAKVYQPPDAWWRSAVDRLLS